MILCSIGQSYAFAGDFPKAFDYFLRAIKQFGVRHCLAEMDQTGVYCAHNVQDCHQYPDALKNAEKVFKCDFKTAIAHLAGTVHKPYHHHLLVKNLFFNPEAAQYKKAYLAQRKKWQDAQQHPWELIGLYRMLLLQGNNPPDAKQFSDKLWELFSQMEGGATINLIEAFVHCAAARFCGITQQNFDLGAELASIQRVIPGAAQRCNALLQADKLTDKDFWSILSFNYK